MQPNGDNGTVVIPALAKSMTYGRYNILGLLGKGSMGKVYHAHDPQIDRPVALKVLRRDHVANQAYIQCFTKEAKAVGRLSHPNIVTIHDVGEDHGTVYIAMELIEGKPLSELIKTTQFDLPKVIDVGIQVAEALDYAHQKGVIHRDIKPSNLIVLENGQIKLTDFGVAYLEDPSATHSTLTGNILGTPSFMSPEQIEGKAIDGRSDLFSLGVILYRLTAGQWPFAGDTLPALFYDICNHPPKRPSAVNPALPKAISALILKSLEKKAQRRFQTGREMVVALQACRSQAANPAQRLTRAWMVFGLLAVGCLAGLGSWLILRHDSGNAPSVKVPKPVHMKLPLDSSPAAGKKPSRQEELTPTAQTVRADVTIRSDPADAHVYINNQLQGRTPTQLKLPLGVYQLRLYLSGHYETNIQFRVSDDQPMPLRFRLAPAQ